MVAVVYASSEIAPPGQGHLQSIVGQLDRCVGPYGSAHNLPRPYVYLERQVQSGLPELGIDNVCEPRPVGPSASNLRLTRPSAESFLDARFLPERRLAH